MSNQPGKPVEVPDAPLKVAVERVVADVRTGWPDASAVDAITFVLETVGVGDLDKEDPNYLAYLVVLVGSTPSVALGFAQRQVWAEDKARAAKFKNGDHVQVMTTGVQGVVKGNPMPSPLGWVVTVNYTPEFEHLAVTRGADYKVTDLMHYTP